MGLIDIRTRLGSRTAPIADVTNLRGRGNGYCEDKHNASNVGCHRRLMKPFLMQGCCLQGISEMKEEVGSLTLRPCHLQLLLRVHYYYCPLAGLLVIPFPTNCTSSQPHSLLANFSTNCIRCQSTSPAATCLHCPPVSPFLTVPLRSGVT